MEGQNYAHEAQSDHLFTVINTGLHDKVDTVSTVIDVATCDFKELHPTEGYKKMAALTLPSYRVEDLEGHAVEAKIEDLGELTLSMICQRQVPSGSHCSSSARDIPVHLAPLSWTTFQLLEGKQEHRDGIYQNG